LAVVLSVLFRFTDSDCSFGIFKLFYITEREIKRSGSRHSDIGSALLDFGYPV